MNELIRTDINNQTVSARELHKVLEIEKRFSVWFETNSQGFVEGEDYTSVPTSTVVNNGAVRELEDYQCSMDMAKHICLMSRTEKGKKCRQYLIEMEKAWNTPELIMARALKMADRQITVLKEENKQLTENNASLALENNQLVEDVERARPYVEFSKTVSGSQDSIHIGQFAKLIGVGQNTMFDWLRKKGYLGRAGSNYNMPIQKYLNMGIFSLKENIAKDRDGNTIIYPPTPLVTGKGQVYLHNKYNQEQWQQATLF